MAFMKLCKGDDLVDILRDIFKANILQIPRADVLPLGVIIHQEGKTRFWGDLNDVLVDEFTNTKDLVEEVPVPDLSGRKSRQIDLNLGLKILTGFLNGFSIPLPNLSATFKGDRLLNFSFSSVKKCSIPPARLGKALIGHQIDKYNPAAGVFFGDNAAQLFLIDSVVMSRDFSVHVNKTSSKSLDLEVEEVQSLFSDVKAGVSIRQESTLDMQFAAEQALTFAFTCLQVLVEPTGGITLRPYEAEINPEGLSSRDVLGEYPPVLLHQEPGMMDWDAQP